MAVVGEAAVVGTCSEVFPVSLGSASVAGSAAPRTVRPSVRLAAAMPAPRPARKRRLFSGVFLANTGDALPLPWPAESARLSGSHGR